MTKIPEALKRKILLNPFYKTCVRDSFECQGRITFEHAIIYGGKQVQEEWAIIPLCAFHHAVDEFQDGGALDKNVNKFIALMRCTDFDNPKYPRNTWKQERDALIKKFQKDTSICKLNLAEKPRHHEYHAWML